MLILKDNIIQQYRVKSYLIVNQVMLDVIKECAYLESLTKHLIRFGSGMKKTDENRTIEETLHIVHIEDTFSELIKLERFNEIYNNTDNGFAELVIEVGLSSPISKPKFIVLAIDKEKVPDIDVYYNFIRYNFVAENRYYVNSKDNLNIAINLAISELYYNIEPYMVTKVDRGFKLSSYENPIIRFGLYHANVALLLSKKAYDIFKSNVIDKHEFMNEYKKYDMYGNTLMIISPIATSKGDEVFTDIYNTIESLQRYKCYHEGTNEEYAYEMFITYRENSKCVIYDTNFINNECYDNCTMFSELSVKYWTSNDDMNTKELG